MKTARHRAGKGGETCAQRLCRALLFAKDFQKHVEAAELLLAELPAHPEAMMASLDLLFRWAVVRMCDPRANTTCHLKVTRLACQFTQLEPQG